ncbi:MAG: sel1 repeat family protein [Alphaproteobacteria bacterium]|nr:MAG: sel1 repeat family protein [Alphaproteobacteria bacterium]
MAVGGMILLLVLLLARTPAEAEETGEQDAFSSAAAPSPVGAPLSAEQAPAAKAAGDDDIRLGDAIAGYALQRFAEARRDFRKLAEAGNAQAAWRLAQMIEKGIGGPADHEEALYWQMQAARAGHQGALARLAALGLDPQEISQPPGMGKDKDPTPADTGDGHAGRFHLLVLDRARLERMADEGRVWAMIELARKLAAGDGGAVDLPAALRWLERARERTRSDRERTWLEHSIVQLRNALIATTGTASHSVSQQNSASSRMD